jgi:hypothetical protein
MGRPPWKIRRRIVIATLIFCAFCVLWIMFRGTDRGVEEVIVMCSFGLAAAVIGSYVFGAAYDDKNVMRHLGPKAYEEPSQYDPR